LGLGYRPRVLVSSNSRLDLPKFGAECRGLPAFSTDSEGNHWNYVALFGMESLGYLRASAVIRDAANLTSLFSSSFLSCAGRYIDVNPLHIVAQSSEPTSAQRQESLSLSFSIYATLTMVSKRKANEASEQTAKKPALSTELDKGQDGCECLPSSLLRPSHGLRFCRHGELSKTLS
jgi:hypothetical protein